MYFWNITKLKDEIRGGGPSENEGFKYLLAFAIFFALLSTAPKSQEEGEPALLLLSAFAMVGILSAAVIYCYQMNGGAAGRDFLKRFLSIAWVIGWRSLLVAFPVLIGIIYVFVYIFYPSYRVGRYFGLLIGTVYWFIVIAIMGAHVKDVSRSS